MGWSIDQNVPNIKDLIDDEDYWPGKELGLDVGEVQSSRYDMFPDDGKQDDEPDSENVSGIDTTEPGDDPRSIDEQILYRLRQAKMPDDEFKRITKLLGLENVDTSDVDLPIEGDDPQSVAMEVSDKNEKKTLPDGGKMWKEAKVGIDAITKDAKAKYGKESPTLQKVSSDKKAPKEPDTGPDWHKMMTPEWKAKNKEIAEGYDSEIKRLQGEIDKLKGKT